MLKKFLAIFFILAMTFMSASALEVTKKSEINLKPQNEKRMQMNEQKKEMFTKMKEKWDKLSEEQKNEIYSITDQIALLNQDIVDKLYDFKLIDDDMAKKISTRIIEKQKMLKENKKLPMLR